MLGIRCVGVGECQSEDPFVCFGAKPTQRACARDLPQDRKRMREGKVPEQNRRRQRTEKSTEEDSQEKSGVRARWANVRG